MIFLITALDCEARPLIQYYKLQRSNFNIFPLYVGENIKLAITGIGQHNMALACATLAGVYIAEQYADNTKGEPAWLNIGIAGHANFEIGTPVIAHKITDDISEPRAFYPQWSGHWPCVSSEILTVSQANNQYERDVVYDMEAVAFCRTASRFSTVELIHVLKIISDNKQFVLDTVNKKFVSKIVETEIELISKLVLILEDLSFELGLPNQDTEEYKYLLAQFRVTVSNQHRLKQLLRRWRVLSSEMILKTVEVAEYRSISDWMNVVENTLAEMPVNF